MGKDYRTWWRSACDPAWELQEMPYQVCLDEQETESIDMYDEDCIKEQEWAIREGLADNPQTERGKERGA